MQSCKDHGLKGMVSGYATAWVPDLKRTTTLHRKVYYDTHGVFPEVVRHKCDNPRCINPDHLEAGSYSDNMQDMFERNRQGDCRNFGKSNGRTVLTDEAVLDIRTNYRKGVKGKSLSTFAAKYNVGTSQIHRVIKGVHHATNN